MFLLFAGVAALWRLHACGPSWSQAFFVDPGILDVPHERLLRGEWGILRPGLPFEDLLTIYRQLNGLEQPHLDEKIKQEQEDRSVPEKSGWQELRAKILGDTPLPQVEDTFETKEYVTVIRVSLAARKSATATLAGLIREHGVSDPVVKDWVLAQDLVFSSSPGKPQHPQPVKTPAWLVPQRRYQIAAAHFYASEWDDARAAFQEIGQDSSNPWKPWSRYLVARCWVRQAELDFPDNPVAKIQAYSQAQELLEKMLADPSCKAFHAQAKAYRELTRYRTEPASLLVDLLRDQERPYPENPGEASVIKIRDCLRHLRGESLDKNDLPSDLAQWLGVMAGDVPWHLDEAEARAAWVAHPSQPWLVAALASASQDSPALAPLKAAAKKIPSTSPLAPTLRWHLLRLELGTMKGAALTGRLEQALTQMALPAWAINYLRGQRQAHAMDLSTWCAYSSRQVTATEDDYYGSGKQLSWEKIPSERFESATAGTLSAGIPLDRMVSILKDPRLPSSAAWKIAQAAWIRAVLLEHWRQARLLSPFLYVDMRKQAEAALQGTDPVTLRFQTTLFIMKWPGLRPTIDPDLGRQFADAGPDKEGGLPEVFDVLRDNWWLQGGGSLRHTAANGSMPSPEPAPHLSEQERDLARSELVDLQRVPPAQVWFSTAVIAFAKAHPEDGRIPEALHDVVGTTRSPMCPSDEVTQASKRTFQLLHKRYAKDPWAKKTPYYF